MHARELKDLIVRNYAWNTETRNDATGFAIAKQIEEAVDHAVSAKILKEDDIHWLLYTASQYLCEPVINLLIDKYKEKDLQGCLYTAALCSKEQPDDLKDYEICLRKLISAGANVNEKYCDNEKTPLMHILQNCDSYFDKVKVFSRVLLEAGADPTIENKKGMSFAKFVYQSGHTDLIDILKTYTRKDFKIGLEQKSVDPSLISKTQKHPAFQLDWNEEIEFDLMKAPNGTYAIITANQSPSATAGLTDSIIPYIVIYVEDGKLHGHKLTERYGLLMSIKNSEELTTYDYKTVADMVDRQKDKFKLPYNIYLQQKTAAISEEKKGDSQSIKALSSTGHFAEKPSVAHSVSECDKFAQELARNKIV